MSTEFYFYADIFKAIRFYSRIKFLILHNIFAEVIMKIYREIVRNTAMGAQSIDNLLAYIECDKLKNLVLSQKEAMEDFYQKAKEELPEEELDDAVTKPFQRTMLKMGVKMNAGFDNSNSHLASMLIDGYNMGITSVQKCINELERDGVEVPPLARDLMRVYDKDIKSLRQYL